MERKSDDTQPYPINAEFKWTREQRKDLRRAVWADGDLSEKVKKVFYDEFDTLNSENQTQNKDSPDMIISSAKNRYKSDPVNSDYNRFITKTAELIVDEYKHNPTAKNFASKELVSLMQKNGYSFCDKTVDPVAKVNKALKRKIDLINQNELAFSR